MTCLRRSLKEATMGSFSNTSSKVPEFTLVIQGVGELHIDPETALELFREMEAAGIVEDLCVASGDKDARQSVLLLS